MIRFIHCASILAITVLFVGCGDSGGKEADPQVEAKVRANFDQYKSAVLASDGEAAAALISNDSLGWYQTLRDHAYDSTPDQVKALSPAEELMVLTIRINLNAEKLKEMDGRAVFVHAVNEGWIGKEGISQLSLGDVEINESDDTVQADALVGKETTDLQFTFAKEESGYKILLDRMIDATNKALKQKITESGQAKDEFVTNILAFASGEAVPASIWEPLNEAKRTKFDVILTAIGENKIAIIKAVREATKLPLTEAKALVDNVPSTIKQGLSKEAADALAAALKLLGCKTDIR